MNSYTNSLTEKEIKQVSELIKLKKDIMTYINMEQFIERAREVIDNSSIFEFRSTNSRLFIDKNRPAFILRLKDSDILERVLKHSDPSDEISNILTTDIINNISALLTESIKESDNELFKDIPKELTEFIISNVYVIRSNIKDNNIQLYFFI